MKKKKLKLYQFLVSVTESRIVTVAAGSLKQARAKAEQADIVADEAQEIFNWTVVDL